MRSLSRALADMGRPVLIVIGTIFVGLGLAGVFLPLVPGMPFFLVAAWCYARSSPRFYSWLLNNRICGAYIRDYQQYRGMRMHTKVKAISILWIGITCAGMVASDGFWLRLIMVVVAISVTCIILSVKTIK